MYRDPMSNYLRSLMTTAPLTIAVAFIVLLIFLAVRWQRRQLSGQNCWKHARADTEWRAGPQVRGSVYEWPSRTSSAPDCSPKSSLPAISVAVWTR